MLRQEVDVFVQTQQTCKVLSFVSSSQRLLTWWHFPAKSCWNFLSPEIRLHLFGINLALSKMPASVLLVKPAHINAKQPAVLVVLLGCNEKANWGSAGGIGGRSSAPGL